MLDGRFDQQFAEIFAGKCQDPLPPPAPNGAGVFPSVLVFLTFAAALTGLAVS